MAADLFTNVFPFTRKGREASSLSVTGGAAIPPMAEEEVEDVATGVALQGLDATALVAVATIAAEEELSAPELEPEAESEAVEEEEEPVPVDPELELEPEPEEDESPTMNLVQSSWEPRLAMELSTG